MESGQVDIFAQLIRLRTELFVGRLACSSIVNTFGGRNPSSPSSFLSSWVKATPLFKKGVESTSNPRRVVLISPSFVT